MALSIYQVFRVLVRTSVVASFLAALTSVLLYCFGLYLRQGFHSGIECDMTWSNPGFIVLDESAKYSYRFLRFADRRDGRLVGLYDTEKPISEDGKTFQLLSEYRDKSWCNLGKGSQGYPVVFIGGNGSNYNQARSLGAFGINLTQRSSSHDVRMKELDIKRKLIEGSMTRNATSIEDFVFDVYTLDFKEERGALHASMLFSQADYVAHILNQLSESCNSEVVVVAHSIGGLVARMGVLKANQMSYNNRKQLSARNIITLATPHAKVDLAFEPSIQNFHQYLVELENEKDYEQYNIFSISGGFRDELISPKSCELNTFSQLHASSFISTDLLPKRKELNYTGNNFGIDHQAIVWCHGLLSIMRVIIHTIATSDTKLITTKDILKVSKLNSSHLECETFPCFYDVTKSRLENIYGYIGAFAIRISMVYNMKSLVYLYGIDGMLHFILVSLQIDDHSSLYSFFPILSVALLPNQYRVSSLDSKWTLLTVAYLATSIYFFVLVLVLPCLQKIMRRFKSIYILICESEIIILDNKCSKYIANSMIRHQGRLFAVYVLSAAAFHILMMRFSDTIMATNRLCFEAHFFLLFIFLIWCNLLTSIIKPSRKQRFWFKLQNIFTSVLLVVFPFMTIGKIHFATSLLTENGQSKAMTFLEYEKNLCVANPSSWMTKVRCLLVKQDLSRFNLTSAVILLTLVHIDHRNRFTNGVCKTVDKVK